MTSSENQQKLRSAHALHQRGALDQAAALYRDLIAADPRDVQALHLLGLVEASRGRFTEAVDLMERALAVQPNDVATMENYATALYMKGEAGRALTVCEAGLRLNPRSASLLYTNAVALARLGRLDEALARFDRLLAAQPDHVAALNERGSLLAQSGKIEAAIASVDQAIRLAPNFPDAYLNMGNLLGRLRHDRKALAAYDRALALSPRLAKAWFGRGAVLRQLEQFEEALASYDKAIAIAPDYAEALGGKAQALQELGRMEEAGAVIDRAIELGPKIPSLYYTLALSRRLLADDPRLPTMEALAREIGSFPPDEQIALNFALAKVHADHSDYESAFPRLLQGNALKRRQIAYDEAGALGSLKRTAQAFPAERLRRDAVGGEPSRVPVFVLGMPRSGTTLIEQILASHPQVHGAGEIADFGQALTDLGGDVTAALDSPEAAAGLDGDDLRRLGGRYVELIRARAPEAARIVNKTPGNFRLIGLLRVALPGARIIHTRRDPVDTCLSNFWQLFGDHLSFAFDLGELGRYYRAYDALMAHWRAALPDEAMLEVQYEDVVADLEGQARRIVAHCGLDWDPRCLDFHRTERPVRTASVTQVRQPIYKSSVGRWRAYAKHLGPLLAELGVDPEAD